MQELGDPNRIDRADRAAIFPGRPADVEPPAEGSPLPAEVQGRALGGIRATLVYHLRSGRIVREPTGVQDEVPAEEVRDHALRTVAQAMLRSAGGGRQELVPLLTITDDLGRDHIIPTLAVEDIELVLEP